MADDWRPMLEHAEAFLTSAGANLERRGRAYAVAYDEARHAAEIAGKALLLRKHGDYPSRGKGGHRIGGLLAHAGLVPVGVDLSALNQLMDHHTRGAYGFSTAFAEHDVRDAIDLARSLVEAVRTWPAGPFQPPLPDWTTGGGPPPNP